MHLKSKRGFIVVLLLIFLLSSTIVNASVADATRAGFRRLSDWFQGEGWKSHQKLFDFMIFFIVLGTIMLMGLNKWATGEYAKSTNATTVLAFTLGAAMSIALIQQQQFSVSSFFFPLAKYFLYLIVTVTIWLLLSKLMNKWLALLIAVVASIFLFGIVTTTSLTQMQPGFTSWTTQPAYQTETSIRTDYVTKLVQTEAAWEKAKRDKTAKELELAGVNKKIQELEAKGTGRTEDEYRQTTSLILRKDQIEKDIRQLNNKISEFGEYYNELKEDAARFGAVRETGAPSSVVTSIRAPAAPTTAMSQEITATSTDCTASDTVEKIAEKIRVLKDHLAANPTIDVDNKKKLEEKIKNCETLLARKQSTVTVKTSTELQGFSVENLIKELDLYLTIKKTAPSTPKLSEGIDNCVKYIKKEIDKFKTDDEFTPSMDLIKKTVNKDKEEIQSLIRYLDFKWASLEPKLEISRLEYKEPDIYYTINVVGIADKVLKIFINNMQKEVMPAKPTVSGVFNVVEFQKSEKVEIKFKVQIMQGTKVIKEGSKKLELPPKKADAAPPQTVKPDQFITTDPNQIFNKLRDALNTKKKLAKDLDNMKKNVQSFQPPAPAPTPTQRPATEDEALKKADEQKTAGEAIAKASAEIK